ncbi:hypothetical protein, partial [Pseudomonas gessardii]|uniref:hypothetical protein n=1 Tax=Pseudomonas gessardii TaxID=78544 RepID=UPI001F374AAF
TEAAGAYKRQDRDGEVRAVFQDIEKVGFITGAGGLSVRQNTCSGQKMDAQDARKYPLSKV